MRPSLIRETEVRISTEGLNTTVDDYRLRISPTNPWEIRSNNRYRDQLEENTRTRYRISFSKALKARYELLLEHYYLSEMTRLTAEEISIRKGLSQQAVGMESSSLSVEDLIELESELSAEELKLALMKVQLSELNELIHLDLTEQLEWGGFKVIRPETILDFLDTPDSIVDQNLYKLEAEQKLALEEKMYGVSKTEAYSNIGFLQANYEVDQGDTFEEHMGLRLGITLPIANRDKADLARDRFELIEAKTDKEETEQMIDQRLKMLKSRLKNNFDVYALINDKLERIEGLRSALSNEVDLQDYFRYTNYHTSLLKKRTETHKDLLEDFIDLLDLQGLLVKSPMQNYLSDNLSYMQE